jgi:hypothetical protein
VTRVPQTCGSLTRVVTITIPAGSARSHPVPSAGVSASAPASTAGLSAPSNTSSHRRPAPWSRFRNSHARSGAVRAPSRTGAVTDSGAPSSRSTSSIPLVSNAESAARTHQTR